MIKMVISKAKLFKTEQFLLYGEKADFKRACATYKRNEQNIELLSLVVDKDGKTAKEWRGYIPNGYTLTKLKTGATLIEYNFILVIPAQDLYKMDENGNIEKDENENPIVIGKSEEKNLFYTLHFLDK